jgi:hypothetical protein
VALKQQKKLYGAIVLVKQNLAAVELLHFRVCCEEVDRRLVEPEKKCAVG